MMEVVEDIAIGIIGLNFIISLFFCFKRDRYVFFWVFPFYFLFSIFTDILPYINKFMLISNNLFELIHNIYFTIETIIFLYLFSIIITLKRVKKLIRVLLFVVPIIFPLLFNRFDYLMTLGIVTLIEGLIIIGLAIIYMYQLFSLAGNIFISQIPFFWFAIGAGFYFIVVVPYFLIEKYLINIDFELWRNLGIINHIALIIMHFMFFKSYTCKPLNKPL
jgi:hypothetical protein